MYRMEWWVCRENGAGSADKCFSCMTKWEAEDSAAFLNRFRDGVFRVIREERR